MARRQYIKRLKCTESGCNEWAHYSYDTRREYDNGQKTFTCVRHYAPDVVLTTDNTKTELLLVCKEYQGNRYWQKKENEGTTKLESGFAHGNCYKAFAEDFPVGTLLKLNAEIIKTEDAPKAQHTTNAMRFLCFTQSSKLKRGK